MHNSHDILLYTHTSVYICIYLWQLPGNAARRKLLTKLHRQGEEDRGRERELLIKSIKRNDLRYMRALKYATKVSVTLTAAKHTRKKRAKGEKESEIEEGREIVGYRRAAKQVQHARDLET